MSSKSTYRNQSRRRYNKAFKREVVERLLAESATVAEIARAYDLHPNLLCRWRTEYWRGEFGVAQLAQPGEPVLLPVKLIEAAEALPAPAQIATATSTTCLRRLRIVLSKGQMHLEDVDRETLGLLIEALR